MRFGWRFLASGFVIAAVVLGVGAIVTLPITVGDPDEPELAVGIFISCIMSAVMIWLCTKIDGPDCGAAANVRFFNWLTTIFSGIWVLVMLMYREVYSGVLFAAALTCVAWGTYYYAIKNAAAEKERQEEAAAKDASPTGLRDEEDPGALDFSVEKRKKPIGNEAYRRVCENYGRLIAMRYLILEKPKEDYEFARERLGLKPASDIRFEYFAKVFCEGKDPRSYVWKYSIYMKPHIESNYFQYPTSESFYWWE